MKILVTGASGFLGSHLCRELGKSGHAVTAVSSRDANLREQGALDRYNATSFDRVYHLAAWTQAGDFCLTHAGEQWVINQQINTTVLDWWQRCQPQAKMIAIGSSCCYEPGLPHVEENFLRGEPIESLFTYAMTKRMLYTGLRALNKQFGLKYLFVIPSTLYGPDYHLDGRQMHFIFDLMRKIVEGKYLGNPVVLWGDGSQKRELIHVSDFVREMNLLADSHDNEIVNIGEGTEHSIREFAQALCNLIGFDAGAIHYDTSKYVGAKSKVLDIKKLQTLLPNSPRISLGEGLKGVVEWYVQNAAPQPPKGNSETAQHYLDAAELAMNNKAYDRVFTLLEKAFALDPNSDRLQQLTNRYQDASQPADPKSIDDNQTAVRTAAAILSRNPLCIDQFVTYYAFGDGVGNCVGLVAKILREWGFPSHIFAESGDKRLEGEWYRYEAHHAISSPRNVVLYHPSDGTSELIPYLKAIPDRKYLYYHNITPAEFFAPWDARTANICATARTVISEMRPMIAGSVSDSAFNSQDLVGLGYAPSTVLHLPFFRQQFLETPADEEVLAKFNDGLTNIIFVGRFAPNKCQHDVINAFAEYQRKHNPNSRLILCGSQVGSATYTEHLRSLSESCGAKNIVFTDHISFNQLIAYYRVSHAFLCLTEHEGFCIPLLEAMQFNVPILAFDGSAVSETLDGCASLVQTKDLGVIADQLHRLLTDAALRENIIGRQQCRLESFTEERYRDRLAGFLRPILCA